MEKYDLFHKNVFQQPQNMYFADGLHDEFQLDIVWWY